MIDDTQAMNRCIELAAISARKGNHPFGALIALNGEIIAEGENCVITELDPAGHAEVAAIRNACRALGTRELNGATLYTSCEPCLLCSTEIRLVGISRVVYAATSPGGYGGDTSIFPVLRVDTIARVGAPPEIVAGFMAEPSAAMWRELGWPAT